MISHNDIDVALGFLPELGQIVIQCYKAEDIGYVRRHIFSVLGEPLSNVKGQMKYEDGLILLRSTDQPVEGFDPNSIFFVGGNGWSPLDYVYPSLYNYDYWNACGQTLADVYYDILGTGTNQWPVSGLIYSKRKALNEYIERFAGGVEAHV